VSEPHPAQIYKLSTELNLFGYNEKNLDDRIISYLIVADNLTKLGLLIKEHPISDRIMRHIERRV